MTDPDEQKNFEEAMERARLKLREAETLWHIAFGLAPVGLDRIYTAEVYERVRCATRRE